ncbi:MAG TPA: pyrroline-5-carboxylate reductase [Chthonomonadaceae bacterium]|nr:pyrroline-5-carboxylate reductase [Chthonomonadaceae bacterium]
MAPPPTPPADGSPTGRDANKPASRRPAVEPPIEPSEEAPAESPAPQPERTRSASPPTTSESGARPAASASRRAAGSQAPAAEPPAPESDTVAEAASPAPSAPTPSPPNPEVRADPPPARPPGETSAPTTAPTGAYHPMLRDKRIGIIGAGAMGGALCRGIVHEGAAPANRILVSDPHAAHVQKLQQTLGVKVAESNSQVAKYTDIIILAVKPYMVATVLDEIRDALKRDEGKPLPLIISIAAGIHIDKLEAHLNAPLPVVRAMPNTPAQVGKGACAYCRGTHADDAHTAQAAAIFEAVGIAVEVPESWMDAVTALSGSGPAYVYLMIEALVDGGVKVGLPREVAHQLAAQTVLGAAQMVIETGMHPAQLRDMVTTPAGSTIVALAALEHSGLRAALIDAVERATARSRELA